MEPEKEDLAELKELMDYYKKEMDTAAMAKKSLVPFKHRYFHSAIQYFKMLESLAQEGLSKRSGELDSMLENLSEAYIPNIVQCRSQIADSIRKIGEYSAKLEELEEEKNLLAGAG